MSLLSDIISFKRLEDEQNQRDIQAVGGAINNFVALRRQSKIDELNRRNIDSQIEGREPGQLEQLIEQANAAEAARTIGDRNLFNSIAGNVIPEQKFENVTGRAAKELTLEERSIQVDSFTGKPTSDAIQAKQNLDLRNLQERKELEADISVKTAARKNVLERVEKLRGLLPVVDQFDAALSSIPVGTGVRGRLEGLGSAALSGLQVDPFVSTVRSELEALRPQVARGFGDVGNLTELEQRKAIKFVAQDTDNAETRALKTLGGLVFVRRKLIDSVERSEVSDDPKVQEGLAELNRKINNKMSQAITLGLDEDRINKFIKGAEVGDVIEKKSEKKPSKIKFSREELLKEAQRRGLR